MTDAILVRRVLDGDPRAFTTLVDRHADACLRFATRMLVTVDEEALGAAAVGSGAAAAEWRAEIDRALALLEHDQREAFLLKHVEQLSYEEMAEVTGAGVSALKMRVKRACERLQALLGEVSDVE